MQEGIDRISGIDSKAAEEEFWGRFKQKIREQGVVEKNVEWYVKRASQFVERGKGLKLKERTSEDVKAYVVRTIDRWRLEDWQISQLVDSLRVLFVEMVKAEWARSFQWDKWKQPHLNFPHETGRYLGERMPLYRNEPGSERFKDAIEGLKAVEMYRPLLDSLRAEIRRRHYSIRTEQTYEDWIKRFITFHEYRDPKDMGAAEVKEYLNYLADVRRVAASTQNQALNAMVFLYNNILKAPFGDMGGFTHAKRPARLPVVLTRDEVTRLLGGMSGQYGLMAGLLYGAGLRLMECVRLRVKDVDFEMAQILVRDGKGQKDRITMLPQKYIAALRDHLVKVKALYESDLANGVAAVYMWESLERKFPKAGREWGWQYVFPSASFSTDPRSGKIRRHHINEGGLQREVKAAAKKAGLVKQVSCHTLRHSFATHLLAANMDIRTVQELLGHADVSTTMIYTHVLNKPGLVVRSPADMTD
ncbi:MAG: integron integrase [Lentisphaerales bacterium]|jgi:integron integrase|nr:MAG: integron integrase [Lentisphaerales bacterium]